MFRQKTSANKGRGIIYVVAGVEGLEPPAPGFGDRDLRVIWGKMVAFGLHAAHHLPPIPTQKLQLPTTISYSASSC